MEDYLRGCSLDWTVMRVPYATDHPPKGTYRTAYGHALRAAFRIGQADAARFMRQLIGQRRAMREVITVAY
ncbi:NAD(P)H-binding protein [Spirillospora sp. NPDC127200]